MRSSILAVASSLVLAGAPQVAQAAGLGRLVVLSALGQPLRAEIELTATRQELLDMRAKLASPETFKQAGLDYAAGLMGVRFSIDKRPNGQAIINLTSDRPMNDPFIDMLLELNWASGRLVREYTFLLNPQEYVARRAPEQAASVPVNAPTVAATPVPPPVSVSIRGNAAIDNDVRARAVTQISQVQGSPQQAAQKPAGPSNSAAAQPGEGREVKRGETLHRIATEMKSEGVSIDQMLVSLFRANPNAFDGGNMNRLRSGAILSKPEKSAVESVSPREARKIVLAQSSDWNAYQSRLAGVAPRSQAGGDAARQESSGKITAKVEDKAGQASPKDQLKVSRAEAASASRKGGAGKVSDEDLIARDRALKEANDRVVALEKNVADLQKLLELKNQNLADLQKQVAARASAAPASTPAAPTPAATPTPAAATPDAPANVAPPPPPPPPAPAAPVAKPAQPPAPAAAKQPAKPKVVAPPPPPPEPEFFDDPIGYLLDNLMLLAAVVGGILALVGVFLFIRRRRAMAVEAMEEPSLTSTLTSTGTATSLMDSSVFRNTGGQSVDTTSRSPRQTDFSQAGPGSIDTDEVDPVAEADVYMAYGRDAQAEEILLEARQKDPKRVAITLKLLEIYSVRKDVKQFEPLATELYGETGGVGADWDKAAALGRALDPNNPIFRGPGSAGAGAAKAAPPDAPAAPAPIPPAPAAIVPKPAPQEKPRPAAPAAAAAKPKLDEALDFDIGTKIVPPSAVPEQQGGKAQLPDLDFDLGGDTLLPPDSVESVDSVAPDDAVEAASAGTDEPGLEDDAVEFDVNLTESTFLGRVSSEDPSSVDMASIDLDLNSPDLDIELEDQPSPANAASASHEQDDDPHTQVSTAINMDFAREQMETVVTPLAPGETADASDISAADLIETQTMPEAPATDSTVLSFDLDESSEAGDLGGLDSGAGEEVATKLDLATAYEEMGDIEGARELLQEVLKEGNASQREAAQTLLDKIG